MTTLTLEHGGQLNPIAQRFNIPINNWLDLSTGIAPFAYPIPVIPPAYWQQLPQPCAALQQAAFNYYTAGLTIEQPTKMCANNILATNGSQDIIQALPLLWRARNNSTTKAGDNQGDDSRVFIPLTGYKEHHKSWLNAGFNITPYTQLPNPNNLPIHSVVVLINPNNPTGQLVTLNTVKPLLKALEEKHGLLIVDEAFMDVISPSQSAISLINSKAIIVLKSVGKFFGLAGIRLGFVAAHNDWVQKFSQQLGPWPINGPAQYVGLQALNDEPWQKQQRKTLAAQATLLEQLLHCYFTPKKGHTITGTALFKTVATTQASKLFTQLFTQLCEQGIYVRLLDDHSALRFGVPDKQGLIRLKQALKALPCL